MRNLKSIRFEQWTPLAQFQGRPVTASTWDLGNDSIICTIGPTEENPFVELIRIDNKSKIQYVLNK
jgi:elongator complex protein 1